jgi:hypothetical protein
VSSATGDHKEGHGSSVADTDCEFGSTDRLDRDRRCLLGYKAAQLSSGVTAWPVVGRSKELSRLTTAGSPLALLAGARPNAGPRPKADPWQSGVLIHTRQLSSSSDSEFQ